jgi:hypothetical protein
MSSAVRKAWKHARNAFFRNWFAPTLLPYENIGTYKYPAMGSAPRPDHERVDDFRTAYKDSVYNVRYARDYDNRSKEDNVIATGSVQPLNIEDQILRMGLLRAEDAGDSGKRADAKKRYDLLWQETDEAARVKEEADIFLGDGTTEPRKYVKDLLEFEQTKRILELQNKDRALDEEDAVFFVEKDANGYPRNVRIAMAELERMSEEVHADPRSKKWGHAPKHMLKEDD